MADNDGKESDGAGAEKEYDPEPEDPDAEEESDPEQEERLPRGLSDGEGPPKRAGPPPAGVDPPAGMLNDRQMERLGELVTEQNNLAAAYITLSLQRREILDELANVAAARRKLAEKFVQQAGLDPRMPWSVSHLTGEIRPAGR